VVTRSFLLSIARWAASIVLLTLVVFFYRRGLPANPTTVAVTFLLLILLQAAFWGLRYAVVTSVAATLCFNYYFLPPLNSFTISDGQNWVALGAFLAVALIGSNFSDRIHQQATKAERSRGELECLYDFGQRLLATGTTAELVRTVPMSIVAAFRAHSAALYLAEDDTVFRAGPAEQPTGTISREQLQSAVDSHAQVLSEHASLLPVSVGVRPIGSVFVEASPDGALPSLETLEAMSALIAISIERTRAVDKLARSDAARESEQLRSALLDAVTHDLRTPLTSIKASVSALLGEGEIPLTTQQRAELLTIIDEESDRLNKLIAQATEMAALEAHQVQLALVPCSIAAIAEDTVARMADLLEGRVLDVKLAPNLPRVRADAALLSKVLVHLLENAAKYSAPGSPIVLAASGNLRSVTMTVTDRGPGIEPEERERIFEKFYRGRSQRYRAPGTGMGLAICKAILEAHGGTITLESRVGEGSTFALTLPIAT
jgi:two-component system sensor histidine kinase KdpD